MKILLDENIPAKLKATISSDCVTVQDIGWSGKKNGELLRAAIEAGFTIFITFDQNLQYQQNISNYDISIIVIRTKINTYEQISLLTPSITALLSSETLEKKIYIVSDN